MAPRATGTTTGDSWNTKMVQPPTLTMERGMGALTTALTLRTWLHWGHSLIGLFCFVKVAPIKSFSVGETGKRERISISFGFDYGTKICPVCTRCHTWEVLFFIRNALSSACSINWPISYIVYCIKYAC